MYTQRPINNGGGARVAITDKNAIVKTCQNFLHWKEKAVWLPRILKVCVLLHEDKGGGKLPGICQEEHYTFYHGWERSQICVSVREKQAEEDKASTGRGRKTVWPWEGAAKGHWRTWVQTAWSDLMLSPQCFLHCVVCPFNKALQRKWGHRKSSCFPISCLTAIINPAHKANCLATKEQKLPWICVLMQAALSP